MTKNNKGRAPNPDATPKTTDSRNYTGTDPFMAKPSRNRQQKRGWQRGAWK